MTVASVDEICWRNKRIAGLRYSEWLGLGRRHVHFLHGHRRLPSKNRGVIEPQFEPLVNPLSQCLVELEKPPDDNRWSGVILGDISFNAINEGKIRWSMLIR